LNLELEPLDLYDYRCRVQDQYRARNDSLAAGSDPAAVCSRFRQAKDHLFANHHQSALDPDQRRGFSGLAYFPYDPVAAIDATIEPRVNLKPMLVETGTGETVRLVNAATVEFEFSGNAATLTLYWIEVYGGGLFLPFWDPTSPDESYGGGRYLIDTVKGADFAWIDEDRTRIRLDFNYAYNPSCSYNPRWSCPLAPPENRLDFPVRAGERKYQAV